MTFTRVLWRLGLVAGSAVFAAFLVLPVAALILRTPVGDLAAGLRHPLVAPALRLSLLTSSISLTVVVVLGTLLSWVLARSRRRATRWLETLVQVPIVMPPAVAGLGLLLAFGRRGLFGSNLAFTTAAVVLAEVFVSAPFFIAAATAAFRRIDERLLAVARSLGASPARVFFRVALPLALPGLAGGAAMSWARSLGEFGATLMFAGNFTGRTQTLPLAVYTAMESDVRAAQALSLVLLGFAFTLLFVLRGLPAIRVAENARDGGGA